MLLSHEGRRPNIHIYTLKKKNLKSTFTICIQIICATKPKAGAIINLCLIDLKKKKKLVRSQTVKHNESFLRHSVVPTYYTNSEIKHEMLFC